MTTKAILAVDQGTTNTKAMLVDTEGRVLVEASRPLALRYPHRGWAELDAEDLWRSVIGAVDECLERERSVGLLGMAITNQRESTLLWERANGMPAGPCVVWQCRRSAEICNRLRANGLEPVLRTRTGLPIDPLFSASKARWLLDHLPGGQRRAADGELCFGTVDSWLLWKLTGGRVHATDMSNASRTQLFNIFDRRWDPDLLEVFDLPGSMLPDVRDSGSVFGTTTAVGRLEGGIEVVAMIGDSHASLFGQRVFTPGRVKATYGTGSSLMTLTNGPVPSERLATTIAWAMDRVDYALEGNISSTGTAVQWIEEILACRAVGDSLDQLVQQTGDSGGVYLVPAFVGLGAPYWEESAQGVICGLTRGSGRAELARAALESVAYQVRDVFDTLAEESDSKMEVLLADGGGSKNDTLMQFQADILDRPVQRDEAKNLSALGAAYVAGTTLGLWRMEDIEALPRQVQRFEPSMSAARRTQLYEGWQAAVVRALPQRGVPLGIGGAISGTA